MRTPLVLLLVISLATGIAFFVAGPSAETENLDKRAWLESRVPNQDDGPKPEFPGEAAAHEAMFLQTPDDRAPVEWNLEAQEEIVRSWTTEGALDKPALNVMSYGPGNFGGRLRGLVVKPDDSDTIVVGSVSGGSWKTTDGGATWRVLDDFLASLAVGSMIVDPDNNNRIWIGTGEGYFNVDAAQGLGIFRSDDFGETWTQLASTMNSDFFYVNRLARIPGTDTLIAATRTGIWRSTNLGTSWTEVSGFATSSRGFVDLKVDPSNTSRLYASHFGSSLLTRRVWRSTNSGATWTELGAAQGLPTTNLRRIELGIGTDGVVYAAVANAADQTNGLYRSPAGGNAFVKTASNTAFIERQGWYDLAVAVDPNNSNVVYMAAVDLFETNNAGTTITKKSVWNPGSGQLNDWVHADHHVITFDPVDSSIVYVGTDGGIYKSTDGAENFRGLNNDLRVAQYYGIAVSPDGERVLGGTQDNGSHLWVGDERVWIDISGGDGGYSGWDQQQDQFIYGSYPGASPLWGSNDGGSSISTFTVPDPGGASFIQPFTLDPNDGNRMIVGTDNIFLSENIRSFPGQTFTDASGPLGTVSATTISPVDGRVAYAGTTAGAIFETTGLGLGGAFTSVDTIAMPNSPVNWVEVDPNDGDHLYAAFGGYGPDRLWRSVNGGASWVSVHGNLPEIPMWSVRVDPNDSDRVWLGSELGLWVTEDVTAEAPSWVNYDYGVALTRIQQIHFASNGDFYLGTHGRGIYRVSLNPFVTELTSVVDSGCTLDDGYLDAGETATLNVDFTNTSGDDLSNVMATLSSTHPSVDVTTAVANLGTIDAGTTESGSFGVEIGALTTCLDPADFAIAFTWDGGGAATADFELILGADPVIGTAPFVEDAEDAMTAYTTEAALGTDDWGTVTDPVTPANDVWFSADVPAFTDKSLVSPWMDVQAGTTTVTFDIRYDMEGAPAQYWDGMVLELRTEDGVWIDIGNLSTVPYDGELFNNNTAPQRPAWSGSQTTWRAATVDLGSTYNGQRVQIRFRVICDTNAANPGGGVWLDDITVTNVEWLDALDCNQFGCALIFTDSFESGDTSSWSSTVN